MLAPQSARSVPRRDMEGKYKGEGKSNKNYCLVLCQLSAFGARCEVLGSTLTPNVTTSPLGSSMAIHCSTPNTVPSASPSKKFTDLISALNSTETMQKSVMNAFALKYSKTASSTVCVVYLFVVLVQKFQLGVQRYHMIPFKILVCRFMGCHLGSPFTLLCCTTSSSCNRS